MICCGAYVVLSFTYPARGKGPLLPYRVEGPEPDVWVANRRAIDHHRLVQFNIELRDRNRTFG
jgi:hypothetical protein